MASTARCPHAGLTPHLDAHPIYRHVLSSGKGDPQLISDFCTESDWKKHPFGRVLARIGIRENLIFCLHVGAERLIFIALNRRDRTFTEEDRAIADFLRPHLTAAFQNAVEYTERRAVSLVTSRSEMSQQEGIVVANFNGGIRHCNLRAQHLIDRFFGTRSPNDEQLPDDLWKAFSPAEVQAPKAKPYRTRATFQSEGSTLSVRSGKIDAHWVLILKEAETDENAPSRLEALGLSRREAEVLHWLAEGKSNSQIAAILGISHRTVDKHLEAVFRTLGVSNRTEAALVAREFG